MKKILCGVLSASMLLTGMSAVYAEDTFSDLGTVKWAAPYIEEMADMGFISGYEDGTFRPNNDVTHLEGLLLFSRALGSNSEAMEKILKYAVDSYGETVKKYNLSFGSEEVCFMLYRGAITPAELDDYIGEKTRNTPLKRYEAAMLITKAMMAEKEAKAEVLIDLAYTDAKTIPAVASKYVYYVTENEIMNGMDGNIFSPNTNVKRSQIAVMLSRAVDEMAISFFDTTVEKVDAEAKKIETTDGSYDFSTDTQMYVEGKLTAAEKMPSEVSAVLTVIRDNLTFVDALASEPDEVVNGVFYEYFSSNEVLNLQVRPTGQSKNQYYECAKGLSVTRNGEKSSIIDFKKGDYVTLKLSNGKVTSISAEQQTTYVKDATISDIEIGDDLVVKIEHEDPKYNGMTLNIANNVSVTKNGASKELSDIYRGDKVTLTLEYGQVTRIVATSSKKTLEGSIREIHISSAPYMVVSINGTEEKYDIPSTVSIKINGEDGSIYDFKLGDTVKITIESQAITAIAATSAQSGTYSITAGVVTAINSSYGFIKVKYEVNGVSKEETVMCKDSTATVVDAAGKTSSLKNINIGDVVTVRGTMDNGAFVASVILIESK